MSYIESFFFEKADKKFGTQKGLSEVQVQWEQVMLTVHCGEINALIW